MFSVSPPAEDAPAAGHPAESAPAASDHAERAPVASHVPERSHNPFVRSKAGGRVLSAAMLPAFMALPPRGWGVLTTTGRKSGKARPKCVRAIRHGEQVHIVSIRPSRAAAHITAAWVLNLRADPNVRLRIRGGTFTGVARELTEAEEQARAKEAYCKTIRPFDYVSCVLHRPGRPTRAKVEALHRSWCDKGIQLVVELGAQHPQS
jgi:deazaflavin-dependent oxidoreductase (nitroreductase family)